MANVFQTNRGISPPPPLCLLQVSGIGTRRISTEGSAQQLTNAYFLLPQVQSIQLSQTQVILTVDLFWMLANAKLWSPLNLCIFYRVHTAFLPRMMILLLFLLLKKILICIETVYVYNKKYFILMAVWSMVPTFHSLLVGNQKRFQFFIIVTIRPCTYFMFLRSL